MEDTPAIAAPSKTAAADAAGDKPQPDLKDASLEQIETLLQTGKLELQPEPGSGGPAQDEPTPPAAKVEPPPVETPTVGETPPAKVEDEVVETRKPEEIEAEVTAAVEAVKAAGGDEAAQEAAAAEARAPKAAALELPPPAGEEEEPKGIHRPRLKNPVDQQIAYIFKVNEDAGTPISWAEAERRVKGDPPAKVEETPPTPALETVVATLEGEVGAIETRLKEIGGDEGVVTTEFSELTIELSKKQSALQMAQRDLKDAIAAEEARVANLTEASTKNRATAMESARAEYPGVSNVETPLGKAVAERIAALKDVNHPDHELLRTDSAPLTIVRDVAAGLGILPKKAAPPAVTKVVVPPKKVVSPPSGAKTSVLAVQPQEEAKAIVEHLRGPDATLEELDAAQGLGDPAKLLVGAAR